MNKLEIILLAIRETVVELTKFGLSVFAILYLFSVQPWLTFGLMSGLLAANLYYQFHDKQP